MQTYSVPGISCGHCKVAIEGEVAKVHGVSAVVVDIEHNRHVRRVTFSASSPSPDDARLLAIRLLAPEQERGTIAVRVTVAQATIVVDDVVIGLQCDPRVVERAWAAGVGADLEVEFNEGSDRPMAVPFRTRATVLELVDDVLVPTRGVYAGSRRHPGRSCALRLHEGGPRGIGVGVSSHAVQCADDDTLRHVGLEPARASVVVVKSRGHFRAGFDHLFHDDQIIEVAAPGVATSDLHSVVWQHLPRPVFPLDAIDRFEPSVVVKEVAR